MDSKSGRPPLRIAAKYCLLQLPGIAAFALILILIRHWMGLPADLIWVLLGIWVGKDIVLFPFLWRFYDPSQQSDRFRMTGRTGFTLSRLDPDGHVLVKGERWQAAVCEGQAPIEKGRKIRVESISGLKLTVKPD
jgi:membrane protein implicated in regulation of membrane protease activity